MQNKPSLELLFSQLGLANSAAAIELCVHTSYQPMCPFTMHLFGIKLSAHFSLAIWFKMMIGQYGLMN